MSCVRRFVRGVLRFVPWLALCVGTAIGVEPPPAWPEVEPALRNEQLFAVKVGLMLEQRGTDGARQFLERELKRRPQPYVKAYVAWTCFQPKFWGGKSKPDYVRGHQLASEAMAEGSAVAQFVLGYAEMEGLGCPVDRIKGWKSMQAADRRGCYEAASYLGFYAEMGWGGWRDHAAALAYLRRAAALGGIAREWYVLGRRYEEGADGQLPDYARTIDFYFHAACFFDDHAFSRLEVLEKKGIPGARLYRALAYVHDANEGVWLTKTRVREQIRVLEEVGHDLAAAQAELGAVYINGDWVGYDYAKATRTLNLARGLGADEANVTLAWMRLHGQGMPRDVPSAMSDLLLLSADGNALAATHLGYLYYWGSSEAKGVKRDPQKAFEFSRKGAEGGSLRALVNLAVCYRDGIGVKKDYAIAAELYWAAARRGYREGLESAERLLAFADLP